MTSKFPGSAFGGRPKSTFGSCLLTDSSTKSPATGVVQGGPSRPITAVRSAGYSSRGKSASSTMTRRGLLNGASPLEEKNEDTPEEKIKRTEKKVNDLIMESCTAHANRDEQQALEKAKDALKKNRVLVRLKDQMVNENQVMLDLTFLVLFNLANQYANNDMDDEALNTYKAIVKNKMFKNTGHLTVNIANIYFKQQNYNKSLKYYRMALDKIPKPYKELRMRISQDISAIFIHMGQYSEAIKSLQYIMEKLPNIYTGFNLVLCYHAIGDREEMKTCFQKLLAVPLGTEEEDKYNSVNDDPQEDLLLEAIRNDELHQIYQERKSQAENYIMTSANLIAPVIESTFAAGFDWCVDMVKNSQYVELANELELQKALTYLRQGDYKQAKDMLTTLEKKDSRVKGATATNLSFLYFLEKDYDQAEHHSDLAIRINRHSSGALVNKGNVLFVNEEYEKAAECYGEAMQNDSSCTEALYNLGLTFKRVGQLNEALKWFLKLHTILKNNWQVMYQLYSLYEMMDDPYQAIDWLEKLNCATPTNYQVLAKLGELYDNLGNKKQAFQYYSESFRCFPSNTEVIRWLGSYNVDAGCYDVAIQLFERAAHIEPTQVLWKLMVASCYRRSGNYQVSLQTYMAIHQKFPENEECLRFLVRLCTDMGLQEVQDYATKLMKVEKRKELQEQWMWTENLSNAGDWQLTSSCGTDTSYVYPIEPQMERPKTRRQSNEIEVANDTMGNDLPE